jgi:hypothetical protein
MGLRWQDWPPRVLAALRKGTVIPCGWLQKLRCRNIAHAWSEMGE